MGARISCTLITAGPKSTVSSAGNTQNTSGMSSLTGNLAAVSSASEDVGLGNPTSEAASEHESNSGHLAEDFDVTENLRD